MGCSGRRRIVQLRRLFPEVATENIRGNVLTRLRKLDEDAEIVLLERGPYISYANCVNRLAKEEQ